MNRAELDLIHRELDGENSPEESRRLDALLADNPEARRLFEDLSVVESRLQNAEMVEPPALLKQRVMEALPASPGAAAERSSHSTAAAPRSERKQDRFGGLGAMLRGLRESMQARPALAYAYTFALGLAAGLAIFAIALQDSATADGPVFGTLVEQEALEGLSIVEATPIQVPGLVGEVELLASRELFVVDLTINAEERTDIRLVPEPSVALRGFTRRTASADASFDMEGDAVVLDVQGSERYSLLFDRADETESVVRLEVRRDGRLMYEDRLRAD